MIRLPYLKDISIIMKKIILQRNTCTYLLEGLPREESLYSYGGVTYSGGGNGNNNRGDGGGDGGYSGGGGNGPRKRLRKEPREVLPIEKREIPLGALSIRRSACKGNKRTY